MDIAVGFNSLTTNTYGSNDNLPTSGQQVTARLSARKVCRRCKLYNTVYSTKPWGILLSFI